METITFVFAIADEVKYEMNKGLATGLEWNDPLHVNIINRPEDRRQLCLILIKIAQMINLPLSPYFQDYELVKFTLHYLVVLEACEIVNSTVFDPIFL